MRYCVKCGNMLDDNQTFCQSCGHPIDNGGVHSTNCRKEQNIPAIAAIICTFIMPILGIVRGFMGLSEAKQNNGKGRILALVSTVFSIIFVILEILFLFLFGFFLSVILYGDY